LNLVILVLGTNKCKKDDMRNGKIIESWMQDGQM